MTLRNEYVKFRFTTYDLTESTAGLVMRRDQFKAASIADLSRMFPTFETMKMQLLQISNPYGDWNSAFNHSFDPDDTGAMLGPNAGSWQYNVNGLDHQDKERFHRS